MTRVFLVEDQVVLRDFIRRLLKEFPQVQIVGESGNGHEALEACLKLMPEVIILDLMLPGLNGVEILRRLKRDIPKVHILVFSAFPSVHQIKSIMEAGADGLVKKSESLEILESALKAVINGQAFFSPVVMESLRSLMLNPEVGTSLKDLSTREIEVLQLISESNSNKDIAIKLGISVKTAETHRNNIMRKLDIHDAVGLTRFAIANGVIKDAADTY